MVGSISRCIVTGASDCPLHPTLKANKVFVAMPFEPSYDDVYLVIRDVLQKLNYEPYRADFDFSNAAVLCKVCLNMQEAKYAVCEVSDWNANVLLELGLAVGLSRYTILLREQKSAAPVPSDLRGIEYLPYSRDRLLSAFRQDLEAKFERVKTMGYEYDPYLANYDYRATQFNIELDVRENGDTNTEYGIRVQRIRRKLDREPIMFKMPYHDTPSQKTSMKEFNLQVMLASSRQQPQVDWILKSNVWKRFRLVLPPLEFEQDHFVAVTMFEKSLFEKDEQEDFYDTVFHYPTEDGRVDIVFPETWDIAEEKVVIGETGEKATEVVSIGTTRDRGRRRLSVCVKRPIVDATYLITWKWLS